MKQILKTTVSHSAAYSNLQPETLYLLIIDLVVISLLDNLKFICV